MANSELSQDVDLLIKKHQQALDRVAEEKSKQWWEKYLKGVIPFRGVGIPKNRDLIALWREENGIDQLPHDKQLDIALAFFEESYAEDKLAGILYIQQYLYDKLPWDLQLTRFETLFDNQLIFDWNVCDWFCVRVLSPMIVHYGENCANHIATWKNDPYIWKARASIVPFVNLVSSNTYYPLIKEISSTLIGREERFAKTAVGWVLRDISKYDAPFVLAFLDEYLLFFTRETVNNILKYQDSEVKRLYKIRLRELNQKT
jgi:3-methyladenine DNA glycosylase AlkD